MVVINFKKLVCKKSVFKEVFVQLIPSIGITKQIMLIILIKDLSKLLKDYIALMTLWIFL